MTEALNPLWLPSQRAQEEDWFTDSMKAREGHGYLPLPFSRGTKSGAHLH